MPIFVECGCGRRLQARDEFAGTRAECPFCGREVTIPAAAASASSPSSAAPAGASPAASATASPSQNAEPEELPYDLSYDVAIEEAMDVVEFLDPPATKPRAKNSKDAVPGKPVVQRMLEALLDPRAIQWMLTIGGGLTVIGLVIWLVSLRIFDDPRIMAVALGIGSLAVLGAGWWVALRTKHRVAGQALTFLGCVVAPLNLWFYHAQGLITLDQHLWIGGLVCVGLYAATVYVLRDPLFLYAVEVGVTLTTLLLMADLGRLADAGNLSLFLLALGFLSIHAERAFAPDGEFSRRRYGLPLFWSGHAQLAAALLVLLASQGSGWFGEALGIAWPGNLPTKSPLLAGGLWIAATYLYVYSDLVVRRIGVYTYLAAVSLLMAEVSLVLPHVRTEALIAVLAGTSLVVQILQGTLFGEDDKLRRHVSSIALVLAAIPVLTGFAVHVRATSETLALMKWHLETGWTFVAAMATVAVCTRLSAWLCRRTDPQASATYFFLSAAGLLIAAAGALRAFGWTEWSQQAPVLMAVPIVYIVASRLWRGRSPENPLAQIAHASTAVILAGSLNAALQDDPVAYLRPIEGSTTNLLLGLTFVEATVFYALAGWFRRRSWNALLSTAAACGAVWQFQGYFGVPGSTYALIYAVLGIAGLATGRLLGLSQVDRYAADGSRQVAVRGPGLVACQCGNAVTTIALVAAFLDGLTGRLGGGSEWHDLAMLFLTTAAGGAAIALVPDAAWRRWYSAATVGLGAVSFLTLDVLIDLDGWQKLEIFCVVVGAVLIAAGHVGRFREAERKPDDSVSIGLWLGSLLTAAPPFVAMLVHRFVEGQPSLHDELGLLTATILMLVTGCSWQIKSTTLVGGLHLGTYLLILVASVAYRPEVAVGVYLLVGGGLIFACGAALSVYRDRLLALPEQFARREGLFRVVDWR